MPMDTTSLPRKAGAIYYFEKFSSQVTLGQKQQIALNSLTQRKPLMTAF